jgi:hypothetical protein
MSENPAALVSFKVEERSGDQWIDRGLIYIGAEQADLECVVLIMSQRRGIELRLGERV